MEVPVEEHVRTGVMLDAELDSADPLIAEALAREAARQRDALNLLAPGMLLPPAVREALMSVLGDLDGEGYCSDGGDVGEDLDAYERRYYRRGAQKFNLSGPFAEFVEQTAESRPSALFSAGSGLASKLHVNVQPLSGSLANVAILQALMRPGESL